MVFILEGHNCRDWHGLSLALTKFLPTAPLSGAKKVGHMVVGPSKTLGEVVSVFDSLVDFTFNHSLAVVVGRLNGAVAWFRIKEEVEKRF